MNSLFFNIVKTVLAKFRGGAAPRDAGPPRRPILFIECTHTEFSDTNSGIQRVVRNIVRWAPAAAAAHGYDAIPVAWRRGEYVHADLARVLADKQKTGGAEISADENARLRRELGYREFVEGQSIDALATHAGDVLLLVDSSWPIALWPATRRFKQRGGRVASVIYDLIPLSLASTVVKATVDTFEDWLKENLRLSDHVLGISKATADAVAAYAREKFENAVIDGHGPISWFHLGSELDLADASVAPRPNFAAAFPPDRHVFLMVGSVEPRKGHAYVLAAFNEYLAAGGTGVLLLIGRDAWHSDDLLAEIENHPRKGAQLFLFRDCLDDEVDFAYRNASVLVMASREEGFGLPIVEAMQRGLPVMCSDIPVFREIGSDRVTYFNLADTGDLSARLLAFERAHGPRDRTLRTPTPWLTWKESAAQLVDQALDVMGPAMVPRLVSRGLGPRALEPWRAGPRLFIECTHTYHSDLNTGIQRVVRNIVRFAPEVAGAHGFEAIPVILENNRFIHVGDARVLQDKKGHAAGAATHDTPDPGARLDEYPSHAGSILLLPDATWNGAPWAAIEDFRRRGGKVVGLSYDLIPITHPGTVVQELIDGFGVWAGQYFRHVDAVMGISKFTMDSVRAWLARPDIAANNPKDLPMGYFHLGAELDFMPPDATARDDFKAIFAPERHVFISVGTIEPRKNVEFTFRAFDKFWKEGGKAALVVIGAYAWRTEALLEEIARHPELGRSLFLVRDASDVDLDYAYKNASALVFSSIVEGFGLPLVESFQRGLPVLCSDIPVFREVAEGRATFFSLDSPDNLTQALHRYVAGHDPASRTIHTPLHWQSWRDSVEQLVSRMLPLIDAGDTSEPDKKA